MDTTKPMINVTTQFNADIIEQSVRSIRRAGGHHEILSRNIVRLQDQGIRDALIALGWTPPDQENKPSNQ